MMAPKHSKYRKAHRGRMRGHPLSGATIAFGEYGLQALEPAWISSKQIEAARRTITRYIKRGGKLWIRIFPDKPFTKKPAETRMGSGKGNIEGYVAGVDEANAKEALRLARHKLPIKTKFVARAEAVTS